MTERREFEMSQSDLDGLLKASRPTPAMFLSGGMPMCASPQENANTAWAALGRKIGFKHMTVKPVPGKGSRFFTAEPVQRESAA